MKILVAGGAGYVGTAVVPALLERGYEVDVIDLLWFGNFLPKEVKVIQKDLFDVTEDELKGYDQVIFLAGISNDPMAEISPSKNFLYNAALPGLLCFLSKKAGVKRFIYASTCSVYGYTVNELYDETRPVLSNYPYGISKLQGERAVGMLGDDNFSVIGLRKGTICGYCTKMRSDLVVSTMFKTAMRDGVVNIHNPSLWRPVLSIQDAVSAYVRAVEASDKISGVFNIASGNYTIGELGDLVKQGIKEHLGKDVKLNIQHKPDLRNYKVSIEKAEAVLSFKPAHDVKFIVKDLIDNMDKWSD